VFGLDRGVRALDDRVARTFDRQIQRGLLEEILSLDARYDLSREFRKRGTSANQVLHTHGYREFFEVAADRGKTVTTLTDADMAEVGERVVERIRAYTRRQRSWFRKLPEVRMVSSAAKAYSHVLATGLTAR
jgi:tRNA dimethylallyltransferase